MVALDGAHEENFWQVRSLATIEAVKSILEHSELIFATHVELAFGKSVRIDDDLRWKSIGAVSGGAIDSPVGDCFLSQILQFHDAFNSTLLLGLSFRRLFWIWILLRRNLA
jgi:hypothetical protein